MVHSGDGNEAVDESRGGAHSFLKKRVAGNVQWNPQQANQEIGHSQTYKQAVGFCLQIFPVKEQRNDQQIYGDH